MSDPIDRQAALEAVVWDTEAYMAINMLPSAQPEILRCKDCAIWDTSWDDKTGTHYCERLERCTTAEFYCGYAEVMEEADNEKPKIGYCIYCGGPCGSSDHYNKTKRGTYVFFHFNCWAKTEQFYAERRRKDADQNND